MTAPLLLTALACALFCAPAWAQPTRSPAREVEPQAEPSVSVGAEADRLLRTLHERSGVPAVQAAVATPRGLVWSGAVGVPDLEHEAPTTGATRFGIGSVSKSITMVAAMRLAERGVLDLDAPIETYLSDFPHAGRGVTIRQIGAHLSGLSDTIAASNRTTTVHYGSPTEAYTLLRDEPLTAEPGERHFYATGSFTLIGAAIESATGRPFTAVVDELVLGPARMRRTRVNNRSADPADRADHATFYVRDPDSGEVVAAPAYDPSYKLPGAGYLSTAEDLCRFGAGLLDGTLIRPDSRDALWDPAHDAAGEDTGFGLGFRVDTLEDGTPVIHQPGGGIGISCWLYVFPVERVCVAVLCNQTSGPAGGAEVFELIDLVLESARSDELAAAPWGD